MNSMQQTEGELINHLKEQIAFMFTSAESYDHGFEGEGRRLAVIIRILVHDTSQSKSLLGQLGKKNIGFLDTASRFNPNNLLTSNCLTMMKYSFKNGISSGVYVAPLDDLSPSRANKKIPFEVWWATNIIYRDNMKNTFTRRDLVLNVANTDGGAHVDPKLDEAYAQFSRFNTLGWKVFKNGIAEDFQNTPVLPSIRQIAHELLRTLKEEFSDLWPGKTLSDKG
jgi:hypothetical protein